ncbi:uncharacterized protein HMPREF1541_09983 [Cyphellophora europaea CBS 101466]|uniref:FAD synthase n=1 Tax=Cyphellophora europaea (strain CBS 101466) TaxID=1220924 RepID=W2S8V3_CYPE1|nr:uncharacterized protein HMPREF1541_09983 [Cyphellophora europaea CBS 101466]ETN45107.1 hypothetical protein HMPREF1541_09983 [Cyphellophora europaea CBS 101466]
MPSDASLPPNAPTTLTTTTPTTATANGTLTPQQQQQQPRSESQFQIETGSAPAANPSSVEAKATSVRSVGGEADASLELLDDEHDGAELEVPPNLVPLREVCADVHARVTAFLTLDVGADETVWRTQAQVRASVEVIRRALEEYEFEQLSLSYNGGKDCLVLLLLYLSVLHTHFTKTASASPPRDFPTSIPSIYATPPDPFPTVTTFVRSSSSQYHLSLTHIRTNPPPTASSHHHHTPHASLPIRTFRDAFALYLTSHPNVRAIFVGTRRTDPHGATLTPFAPTDGNWPAFMRVHPVLDWKLSEIWCFLRHPLLGEAGTTGSEYCHMYDEGYTSLGGTGDTVRNPKLRILDEQGRTVGYRPAWMMVEDGEERAGRE